MNLLLFVATIVISFIVVKIGAIFFELTGLEWSQAKFQALSCFTGTGFTTREAELITGHAQRRKVATYLMVLGHAGLVTLVATFANSIRPGDFMMKIRIPYFDVVFPVHIRPWINLIIMALCVFILFRLMLRSDLGRKITVMLKSSIVRRRMVKPVFYEDLVIATGGYGITVVDIAPDSPLVERRFSETKAAKHDISILALERKGIIEPHPSSETVIRSGDKFICFGKLDEVKDVFIQR
jgi:hypothetical protein